MPGVQGNTQRLALAAGAVLQHTGPLTRLQRKGQPAQSLAMTSLDFDLEAARFHTFYRQSLPRMEQALAAFSAQLQALGATLPGLDIAKVEGRIKDADECVRKFSRKYRPALEESGTPYQIRPYITDLIGLRIVCLYEDEVPLLAQAAQTRFEVLDITDKASAVEATESAFGYKGLHMDLRCRPGASDQAGQALLTDFSFELQIRTLVQDAWSVLDHKIKYKKAVPGPLKRRINVLAALFELADREFRQIREETAAALLLAPDETQNPAGTLDSPGLPSGGLVSGSDLNAFTFLKIATHFFRDFDFEAHKVDLFVDDIHAWSPDITRTRFNTLLRHTIGTVKRYKQHFEDGHPGVTFNPYTVMRHCLYLGDSKRYGPALRKSSREAFGAWLQSNPSP